MQTPKNCVIDNGSLFDCGKSYSKPIRANYCYHHRDIKSVADLKACLRAGEFAWPGGYPLYFITSDGASLSFDSVRKEFRTIVDSMRRRKTDSRYSDGWVIVGCDVNWEDSELMCDHSGERIESAYGD